jgi:hypothetical protein
MKWRIGSCLVIGILASSAAAAEPEPKIVVFVYDYVAVSPTVLAGAERESTRIYQQAGISLSWVNCSLSDHESRKFSACEQVKEPANLFVNLLDPAKATEFRRQGTLGTSFGRHAVVFYPLVKRTADEVGLSKSLVLGCALSHELGHLLLGENSHGEGIMTEIFHRREFERAEKGELSFTPQEAELMRARIFSWR